MNVTRKAPELAEFRSLDWVGNGEGGRKSDQEVHLHVTLRAFGIAEVRLLDRCGVESGERARTGD